MQDPRFFWPTHLNLVRSSVAIIYSIAGCRLGHLLAICKCCVVLAGTLAHFTSRSVASALLLTVATEKLRKNISLPNTLPNTTS